MMFLLLAGGKKFKEMIVNTVNDDCKSVFPLQGLISYSL